MQNIIQDAVEGKFDYENGSMSSRGLACKYAAGCGHVELVKSLVNHGVSPADAAFSFNQAAIGGHVQIVKFLADNGVDVNDSVSIVEASMNGHADVVEFLIDRAIGSDVFNVAFSWACANGHIDVVRMFVSRDINIHSDDSRPLRWADINNRFDVMGYLISKGADVNVLQTDKSRSFASWCKQVSEFEDKIRIRKRNEAQRKIYFWMIEKLYRPGTSSCNTLLMKKYNELI